MNKYEFIAHRYSPVGILSKGEMIHGSGRNADAYPWQGGTVIMKSVVFIGLSCFESATNI